MFEMIVRKQVTRLVNKNRKTKKETYTKAAKRKKMKYKQIKIRHACSSQKVQESCPCRLKMPLLPYG